MKNKLALLGVAVVLAGAQTLVGGQEKTSPAASGAPISAAANFKETTEPASTQAVVMPTQNARYQITAGDELQLHFPFAPDFDQTVTVQPDGYVSLREVGDIHVAGQTKPQVTAALGKAYSSILQEPNLTIELLNFDKPYFLVGGQVANPGKFDMHGPVTIAEAIAMAGGFTGKSKHSDVLLYRRAGKEWVEAQQVNLKKMLRKGDLDRDLVLHPGDLVYVPQNTMSKVSPYIPLPRTGVTMTGSQF